MIYLLIFFICLFGIFHYEIRNKALFLKPYYFLLFVICTLMTGLRYRVGGDALLYENYFFVYPTLKNYLYFIEFKNSMNYQPLWILLVAVCKTINPDYYFYQFVHSVIFNSVLFWFLWKYSIKPFTCLFILFINLLYLYYGFEIQREILAICCFLLSYGFFKNNKWFYYYGFVILAFFFHISAVILIFLPFFKLIKFSRKFVFLSIIISIPLIIGKTVFYDVLSSLFFTEAMSERGNVYLGFQFSGSGIVFFYFLRVLVFLPFLLYFAKNRTSDEHNWLLSSFLVLSILSQVLVGFDRLLNYIYIPLIIFVVDFIYDQTLNINAIKRKILLSGVIVGFSGILLIKLFISNYGNSNYYSVFFPYESVFDKHKTPQRERYLIELWRQ